MIKYCVVLIEEDFLRIFEWTIWFASVLSLPLLFQAWLGLPPALCSIQRFLGAFARLLFLYWNIAFKLLKLIEEVIKPHKRLVEVWKDFVKWLFKQEVCIEIDFDDKRMTKYEVSNNKKYINCNSQVKEYYKAIEISYSQCVHRSIEFIEGVQWRNSIVEIKPNKLVVIHNIFLIACEVTDEQVVILFNE